MAPTSNKDFDEQWRAIFTYASRSYPLFKSQKWKAMTWRRAELSLQKCSALISYLCAILKRVTSLTLTQFVKLISRSLAPDGPSTIWRTPASCILKEIQSSRSTQWTWRAGFSHFNLPYTISNVQDNQMLARWQSFQREVRKTGTVSDEHVLQFRTTFRKSFHCRVCYTTITWKEDTLIF